MAIKAREQAMMYLVPCLSMTRPTNGVIRLPTAVKDNDALIWDRFQPNDSSSGSINKPNPY